MSCSAYTACMDIAMDLNPIEISNSITSHPSLLGIVSPSKFESSHQMNLCELAIFSELNESYEDLDSQLSAKSANL